MPKTTKTKRNRFHQSTLTSSHSSQSTNSNSNKHNNPNANSNSNSNANANATASLNANTSELSRGQRKRNAKREQYLKREKMILSTLSLKRKEDQTKRIDGLDALKEALEGVMTTTQTEASTTNTNITSNTNNNNNNTKTTTTTKIPSMTTNKAKQNLAVNEITHMNLVLQHPSFRSNPMETIKEHLKNTLAEQMKDQSITKHGESLKSRTKKKKVISKKSIHSKYNHKQMKASKNKKRNVQK